jgi:tetratricopeptide (TPR) repeat protein
MPISYVKYIFIYNFILCISATTFAQDGNYTHYLARQFAENGEFAKAAEYYAELYAEEDGLLYYQEYLDILQKLNNYELIEKTIKTAYKKSNNNLIYLIDFANMLQKQNKQNEAEKQFEKIIKELPNNKTQIKQIANKFIELKLYDEAQKCYFKGKDILKNKQEFNLEIANIYLLKNDLKSMVQTYLDEAPLQADNLNVIENGLLQAITSSDEAKSYVEKSLLQRVGKDKSMLVYQDLLVWLYMHQNDFDAAITQAKALDIVRNADGNKVMNIANAAMQQKDYDAAIKGYQYIINKGNKSQWFVKATLSIINVKKDKILNQSQYYIKDLLSLKNTYIDFINQNKSDYFYVDANIELAQLEALYLQQTDSAIARIESLLNYPKLNKDLIAKAKLNLGDYYLILNNPWDARLLYAQVEKDMKGSPLGEEAKYRNARLSYFKGDFEWAQTQLKIIKANTSEYISNDAIDLSVFILDNLNTDETDLALIQFANADMLKFQNKLDAARDSLSIILKNTKGTSLEDDIYYLLYKIERSQQNYANALSYLLKIEENFKDDILIDDALFYIAELYQYYLNNSTEAKDYYERIVLKHKDSTFSIEARKRYRKLRGDV